MTTNTSAPQKLYLMQLSISTVPTANRTLEMVLGCYLIETNDGKHILIDSGFPADVPLPQGAPPAQQKKNATCEIAPDREPLFKQRVWRAAA